MKIPSTGIYFVDVSTTPAQVKFFDFATKKSKNISLIDLGHHMPPHGFDISPDEKWVLEERRIREGPAYLLGSPQLFVLRFGF